MRRKSQSTIISSYQSFTVMNKTDLSVVREQKIKSIPQEKKLVLTQFFVKIPPRNDSEEGPPDINQFLSICFVAKLMFILCFSGRFYLEKPCKILLLRKSPKSYCAKSEK